MRSLLAMRGTCVGCENTCLKQRINPTTATFSDTGQCGMHEQQSFFGVSWFRRKFRARNSRNPEPCIPRPKSLKSTHKFQP